MQLWEHNFEDSIKPDQTFFFARFVVRRIDDLEQDITWSVEETIVSSYRSRGTENGKGVVTTRVSTKELEIIKGIYNVLFNSTLLMTTMAAFSHKQTKDS